MTQNNLYIDNKQSSIHETYFDILRIIASFAVIVIHIAAIGCYNAAIFSYTWVVSIFYSGFSRWAVPVFVMISGALFLGTKRPIKKIFKKNIFRIVTAFIFWSFLYSLKKYINGSELNVVIISFFKGEYHMWFLFMIIGLYMITPLLEIIIKNKKLTNYFLILSLIFSFAVPMLIKIISMFSNSYGTVFENIINTMNVDFFMGYTFYYILGYRIHKAELSKKTFRIIICFGICGFLATFLFPLCISYFTGRNSGFFYDYLTVNVMCEAVFVFCLAKKICEKHFKKQNITNILALLSKYSFGVYLVHVFVIDLVSSIFKISIFSFNPIVSILIISILVFLISYLISAIINKIHFISKYIV